MPKFSRIASYLICKNLTISPPYGPTIHKNTKTRSMVLGLMERVFVLTYQQGMVIPPAEPRSIPPTQL